MLCPVDMLEQTNTTEAKRSSLRFGQINTHAKHQRKKEDDNEVRTWALLKQTEHTCPPGTHKFSFRPTGRNPNLKKFPSRKNCRLFQSVEQYGRDAADTVHQHW